MNLYLLMAARWRLDTDQDWHRSVPDLDLLMPNWANEVQRYGD
jgi:hypothetical protein